MNETPSEAPEQSNGIKWTIAAFLFALLLLIGSIPSGYRLWKMWQLGVGWDEVPFAIHQRALWERNEMCMSAPLETTRSSPDAKTEISVRGVRELETVLGVEVRVQACPNGDVLVQTLDREGKGRAVWVAKDGFVLEEALLSISGEAFADSSAFTPAPTNTLSVMCIQWRGGTIDSGRAIRIVADGDLCTRETINIYSTEVERAERVSCDADCIPDKAE